MTQYKMGVVYQNNSQLKNFINYDKAHKNWVITNFYEPHHQKLDNLTKKILTQYNSCYIIDLHSFSDEFVKTILNKENNPDICLGYDEMFGDLEIVNLALNHFQNYGYSVKINYPYASSIIPNYAILNKDYRVKSLMIEINKRIYLNHNTILNNRKFKKLEQCLNEFWLKLSNYIK